MINDKCETVLQMLGKRLKAARLDRNETQEIFAARLGISRQSLGKMEKGEGAVPLLTWLEASALIDRLDTWLDVLQENKNLFQQFEAEQQGRKRASGKRALK